MTSSPAPAPARRARIEMFGWQPFYRRPVRAQVLAALDELGALAPDHAGIGDGPLRLLDRHRLTTEPLGPGPAVLEISRLAQPPWHALLNLGDRAWMSVSVPATTTQASGASTWFALGERLVRLLQPDFAFVHLEPEDGHAPAAPAAAGAPAVALPTADAYYDEGLHGPALRTCLGARILRQVGADRVRALPPPAVVFEIGDCLCIDLVGNPWNADESMQERSAARVTEALRPTGLFLAPNASMRTPFDRGGVARESPDGMRLDAQARADDAEGTAPDPSGLVSAAAERRALVDVTLSWADLRGMDLSGLVADGLDLSWAQLEGARLQGASLSGLSLASANIDDAVLDEASIEDGTFDRAIAPRSSWRGAKLRGCRFADAALTGADFAQARIADSSFAEAMLGDVRFGGAELKDCSFVGADCKHASFAGAVLHGVDFTDADLGEADFAGAVLEDVRWPAGFQP